MHLVVRVQCQPRIVTAPSVPVGGVRFRPALVRGHLEVQTHDDVVILAILIEPRIEPAVGQDVEDGYNGVRVHGAGLCLCHHAFLSVKSLPIILLSS
jgi:hypothetical protein